MSNFSSGHNDRSSKEVANRGRQASIKDSSLMPPPQSPTGRSMMGANKALPFHPARQKSSHGISLTDTPTPSAPNSPQIPARTGSLSGTSTPSKVHATTLDVPGLTKSSVSPDGRIAQRDIGSKLVIVMVGLPARGKSYITGKIARYLNWLQHPTTIFNVGKRRRVATGGSYVTRNSSRESSQKFSTHEQAASERGLKIMNLPDLLPPPAMDPSTVNAQSSAVNSAQDRADSACSSAPEQMDQSASFFDPSNRKAFQIREQVAQETLDELLDYLMNKGGSVGIFDATNSTLERRKLIIDHIRAVAGPDLGILFLESRCLDEQLLETNMRLKLSGPDYRAQDPTTALEDFRKRVTFYEEQYIPLGDYEEKNNWAYVQMIDVGRKLVTHQIRGFLSVQTVYYLMNFNLAPRQIWLTRHGESQDNVTGQLGGDSDLTDRGRKYATALARFIGSEREAWEKRQAERQANASLPPRSGAVTPPNPEYSQQIHCSRNFCVWSSMLKRSNETAMAFDEERYDKKQMRMLDELNAGLMEGMTYERIKEKYPDHYASRKNDKLHYRYPGPGGEGYLDVINRLQKVIVEVERMTDHVLIVGHKAVTRVLLAYFKGLARDDVADLDVPLNVVYMLEPKPYGVDFVAYRYDDEKDWFFEDTNFELKRATNPMA